MSVCFAAVESVNPLDNPLLWTPSGLGGGRMTTSGERVSPSAAMALAPYYACIRNISEDCAKLPLGVYERLERGRKYLPAHPINRLLSRPNDEMGGMSLRETLTHWALGWGGGIAEIETAGGVPVKLWPIHPSRVRIKRSNGMLQYEIYPDQQSTSRTVVILYEHEVFHLHGLGPDGTRGYDVAGFHGVATESVGEALACQSFGSSFYGNGLNPGLVFKHPGELSPEALDRLRESWRQKHGGPKRAHTPMIVEDGMEVTAIDIAPKSAQLIETRQFKTEEICRWFRMPPHKIQHLLRATFGNIAEQNIEYVVDCLSPWLLRWEGEIDRKLLAGAGNAYAKHTVEGLLRGNPEMQAAVLNQLFNMGSISRNEIRAMYEMEPVEGGDEYFLNAATQPIASVQDKARVDEVAFRRRVVELFLADGTTNDVIYNITNIEKLVDSVGLAREDGYKAPWMPVTGDAGPLVNGELIKDPEEDIIGSDVEEVEPPETPAMETAEHAEDPPAATEEDTSEADMRARVLGVQRKLIAAVVTDLQAVEANAFGKAKSKSGAEFAAWSARFYTDHERRCQQTLHAPALATVDLLTSHEGAGALLKTAIADAVREHCKDARLEANRAIVEQSSPAWDSQPLTEAIIAAAVYAADNATKEAA